MNFLLWTPLSILFFNCRCCEGFLSPTSSTTTPPNGNGALNRSTSRLHGIQEWRDQALESKYTLESYQLSNDPSQQSSTVPAAIPILPFSFTDILLQGQRKQLNLYEQRFHELFTDAVENHCGMVGMGLLAGNGMITTLPLCEVESFTRFGDDENWTDKGDGMGNGSIFVTIRAVGRVKIVESDLMQEEPYMKARVVEILDEDANMESGSGLKEKISGISTVKGESSPLEVASAVAGNVDNLLVSLASLEHKLKEMEDRKKKEKENGDDEVMNRRLVNARLESLFMNDSVEGVDMSSAEDGPMDHDDKDEEEDFNEFMEDDETDDKLSDRVAQFQQAFESAREADNFGYVLQASNAIDDLSQTTTKSNAVRTPKDLAAISWAAFCTGGVNDIQRDVMKIQALDMTNVMQRLQLAAAMLREEKKKLKAKLALAEIKGQEES